jgi:predicted nucleotidyltransferase
MKLAQIINEIKAIIKDQIPKSYKLFLFGSWAKGNPLPTSDLDIGIIGRKKVPWSKMVAIKQKIDEIKTLRKVDIVDLNSVDRDFRENALKHAKLIS